MRTAPIGLTLPGERVYEKWKLWFAWRPVTTISNKQIWLKKIYRRKYYSFGFPIAGAIYGDIFDIINEI